MIDIVWQSIVLHTISFLLFVFLLTKILFQPVTKIMEQRKLQVANTLGKAKDAEQEAKKLDSALQSRLEESRLSAGELMEEFRLRAESERDEIIAATRSKVQSMREENARKLKENTKALLQELEPEVKELGRLIAEKVVGRKLAG